MKNIKVTATLRNQHIQIFETYFLTKQREIERKRTNNQLLIVLMLMISTV